MNRKKLLAAVSGCSRNFVSFFEYSLEYLEARDKELVIKNKKSVSHKDDEDNECCGWCDGDSIEIARFSKKFEETYVHEFSHMTQAVQDTKMWKLGQISTFWEDLAANNLGINKWDQVLMTIQMERDCEKRALKISDEWGLFDHTQYAREANIYLYFYQYVFMTKRWYSTGGLYHPEILSVVPSKLESMTNLKHINMDIMQKFSKRMIVK